ncbi:MAG: hypothetical protein AAF750_09430 [Planctomycetota bacterium]
MVVPNPPEIGLGVTLIVASLGLGWFFAPWQMRLSFTIDEALPMLAEGLESAR